MPANSGGTGKRHRRELLRPCIGSDLHLIADNYATHKHPKVKAWLAKHPRFPYARLARS
jgi:hypothetical protein